MLDSLGPHGRFRNGTRRERTVLQSEFQSEDLERVLATGRLGEGVSLISKREVMPLLLEACPGFEPMWREHLEYWHGEEAGIFNDTSEFARYLVESYGRGETAEFEQAFATVERLIREGDDEARGAATVGVIESVQVQSSHHPFGPEPFMHWLGPLSRQAWFEIEELWRAGGGTLAGVIRAELRAENAVAQRKRWWQFWK